MTVNLAISLAKKNLNIGFDPTLFTEKQIKAYFNNTSTLKPISKNLIDEIYKKKNFISKPFISLNKKITGESHVSKIKKIIKKMEIHKAD